jgi:hypothetical protein
LVKKRNNFGICPARLCASLPSCARKSLNLNVLCLALNLHIKEASAVGACWWGLHSTCGERVTPVLLIPPKWSPCAKGIVKRVSVRMAPRHCTRCEIHRVNH